MVHKTVLSDVEGIELPCTDDSMNPFEDDYIDEDTTDNDDE